MPRKSYSFVLVGLQSSLHSTPEDDIWLTSITMRDWDDDQEISFQVSTKGQVLKTGNLSMRVNLFRAEAVIEPPPPPPPSPEPFVVHGVNSDIGLIASQAQGLVSPGPNRPVQHFSNTIPGDFPTPFWVQPGMTIHQFLL